MTKQLKRYYIDGLKSEITAISLVDYPAVEVDAIALAREQRPIRLASDEKRIMTGVVLRPDFPIYRVDDNGYEYEIVFSKETVEQLEERYMKELKGGAWTTDHSNFAEGLFTVESWLKTDAVHDKSVALGFSEDLPINTWFASVKINDDEIWQRVKRNDFGGFSIEAFCRLSELELEKHIKDDKQENNNKEMNKKETFFEKLKNIFTEVFESEEQPATVEQEEAKTELEEQPVEEVKEEVTEADGEGVAETVPEGEPEHVEEAEPDETAEDIEAKQNLEAMEAKIADLEDKVAKLLEKNAELKKENEKLSAQPSVKPINAKSEKKADAMDIVRQLHEGTYFK